MNNAQVITVTSKGQIAIPKNIRELLDIESGDKLLIYTYGGTIMLKVLELPNPEEFKKLLDEAQEWAKKAGFKESEINEVIKEVRKEK